LVGDPLSRTVVIYRLGEKRVYEEWARVGEGKTVTSAVLPGLRLAVSKIFSAKEMISVPGTADIRRVGDEPTSLSFDSCQG